MNYYKTIENMHFKPRKKRIKEYIVWNFCWKNRNLKDKFPEKSLFFSFFI